MWFKVVLFWGVILKKQTNKPHTAIISKRKNPFVFWGEHTEITLHLVHPLPERSSKKHDFKGQC